MGSPQWPQGDHPHHRDQAIARWPWTVSSAGITALITILMGTSWPRSIRRYNDQAVCCTYSGRLTRSPSRLSHSWSHLRHMPSTPAQMRQFRSAHYATSQTHLSPAIWIAERILGPPLRAIRSTIIPPNISERLLLLSSRHHSARAAGRRAGASQHVQFFQGFEAHRRAYARSTRA